MSQNHPLKPFDLSRRSFLKVLGHVLAAYGLGALGAYQYSIHLEPEWLSVKKIQIPLKKLGNALDGFKVVQISDIHLYPYTEIDIVKSAVEIANKINPNLVVLTGDYVLGQAEAIFELTPVLAQLNPTHGMYAILGNHDYWTNPEVVKQGFKEERIPILVNEGIQISVGRDSLYLAGMDDGWDGRPDLGAALSKWVEGMTSIMLLHEPDFWEFYKADPRIDLQLSGHTHGGQVRLPGIGAPILPEYGRKYDHGLYHFNQRFLYVNRGIGVVPPPVRLNCRPEVTEITLTRS